ncbi:hypothetical protein C2E23DRAFT_714691, partial [Lenzites betulinus]
LHPRYKLQYFRDANWEEGWIDEALVILRREWKDYYKPAATSAMFASISRAAAKAAKQDALEVYLEAPPQPNMIDALQYWNLMFKASSSPLAQMALDFMSIPGKS